MSHHLKEVRHKRKKRQDVIHINTDWRGRAKPGPWYGRYYEDWDAAHPTAWVHGQAVPDGRPCGSLLEARSRWRSRSGSVIWSATL